MFEAFKSWLKQSNQPQKLFDHRDEEEIHVALAHLLYHIISIDKMESSREKETFCEIMREEFELNDEQIGQLYHYVESLNSDFHNDLQTINAHLVKNPHLKMAFMQKLIHMMSLDGVSNAELDVFYDAMRVVFPELEPKSAI
ncbi:hypothetical protein FLL45_05620 [Aliikangiella marina]|uniref:Co-chaperone DjlA N-terminal domain-containing protein n=1 Tax=Aliikangiella marina TaxID=1712262 RepID=A0A545TJM8_9GAMM|nr:TerB family tellurite resistance protein [Aliikangiella marina]TQV77422.1 hypothetical protein FLL45_05620 [Aliikangiella marina]